MKRPDPASASSYMLEVASFDGESQCIEAAAPDEALGGSSGMTIAAWVRRARGTATDCDRLIDFGNDEAKENIVINFKDGLSFENWDQAGRCHAISAEVPRKRRKQGIMCDPPLSCEESPGSAGSRPFPENTWTHVAVVHRSDSTASVFLDGRLCAKGSIPLASRVPRKNYYLGRSHWGHDPYFKGEMRDVLVFNYALQAPELRRCALGRAFTAPGRSAPLMSVASSWREVSGPVAMHPAHAAIATAAWSCGFMRDAAAAPAAVTLLCDVDEQLQPDALRCAACSSPPGALDCPACSSLLAPRPLAAASLRRPLSTDHLFQLGEGEGQREVGGEEGAALPPLITRQCSELCGCILGCPGGLGAGTAALQFVPVLDEAQQQQAVGQLRCCYRMAVEQIAELEAACIKERGGGQDTQHRIDAARDAVRRARNVEVMVRMGERGRLPTSLRREAATRQLVQPPRLAAALDPARGVFHAFAIYELRTAHEGEPEGPWHVYVADVVNMRQLLPLQACWQPNVASLLISVLRGKAGAEHSVVTLKALNEAPKLTSYYEELGFTSKREAFAAACLQDAYRGGEMVLAGWSVSSDV